ALDLTNGREMHGSAVTVGDTTLNPDASFTNKTPISVPGTGAGSANGVVAFNALRQNNRASLVLDTQVPGHPEGVVFAAFGSQGDFDGYHGWLVGFDAKTLKIVTVFNTDPNGDEGAVWQSGAAPSVASNGDLILSTGNGTFDAFTTTTPPGPAAQGEQGFGLGYGGARPGAGRHLRCPHPEHRRQLDGTVPQRRLPHRPAAGARRLPAAERDRDRLHGGGRGPQRAAHLPGHPLVSRHHAVRDDHRPDHRR